MTTEVKRVFSGIQPTGELHLGNYVGALSNWVKMQDEYDETIYCVVDLHAMTVPYDVEEFHAARLQTAKLLLAVGIRPRPLAPLLPVPRSPSTPSWRGSSARSPASASSSG